MKAMKIIACANAKGGVGKTAAVFNLGHVLPGRVLLVDADPQASLSDCCQVKGEGLAAVLNGDLITKHLIRLGESLAILPAGPDLIRREVELVGKLGRERVLSKALDGLRYDFILIDCPPSLGLLTINALAAASHVIIPVIPQQADLRGLALFLDHLGEVQREVNQALTFRVLLTFLDNRLIHHSRAVQLLKDNGLPLFQATISRSIRIAESMGEGRPVNNHKTADQYAVLGRELEQWTRT